MSVKGTDGIEMARHQFTIYYEFSGPTKSEPLREELSAHEVERALDEFPGGLEHYLGDLDSRVVVDEKNPEARSIQISVISDLQMKEVYDAVTRCLRDFDLYGNPDNAE